MTLNLEQINSSLPQTQCQLCGYPDCKDYAKAISEGELINLCQPGGQRTLNSLQAITGKNTSLGETSQFHRVIIDESACIGCLKCVRACPVQAITGSAKHMHTIIQSDCTGCDLCIPVCPVDCIDSVEATDPLEYYSGEALDQTYANRQDSYHLKQKLEQLTKKKPKVIPHVAKLSVNDKYHQDKYSGKVHYQLLRIEKAIQVCNKQGNTVQRQKLELQKQRLIKET